MTGFVVDLLFVIMMCLFLAGGVTYIFKPELGVDLLKRAGMLLLVLLVLTILFAR